MAKLVFNYPYMEKECKLEGKDTFYIGRLNTNDITIPNYALFSKLPPASQSLLVKELTKVSRVHARITKKGEKWYIEDIGTQGLGSNYGTFVNDARLQVKEPYMLENNDRIKFGPVECTFVEE